MRLAALSFDSKVPPTPEVWGGKGAGLVEMTQLGIQVPPGFTIPTGVGRAYAENGRVPKRLARHLLETMKQVEIKTGRKFGSKAKPLLVSVRSGARTSMPGMMDTILNLGLNDMTVLSLAKETGSELFAWDSYRRLIQMYSEVVLNVPKGKFVPLKDGVSVEAVQAAIEGYKQLLNSLKKVFPQDPWNQLSGSIQAVFRSWNSARAKCYREANNIPGWWSTACTVQSMAFGNLGEDCCTGVVFSADPATGRPGIFGEFLVNAQGEDVVAGTRTPAPISQMKEWNPTVYLELVETVKRLETHMQDMVDVEFTVERGKLYVLQVRRAKRSNKAHAVSVVHRYWKGHLTKKQAIELGNVLLPKLYMPVVNIPPGIPRFASGLPASPGAVIGVSAFDSRQAMGLKADGYVPILIRRDTSPDDLQGMLASGAVITATGGSTCHAAVVARGHNIPAVVGCKDILAVSERHCESSSGAVLRQRQWVTVDGTTGQIFLGQQPISVNRETGKEIDLLQRWSYAAHESRPVNIDWSILQGNGESVCGYLADFYLLEKMSQASKSLGLEVQLKKIRSYIHDQLSGRFTAYLLLALAGELRHATRGIDQKHEVRGEVEWLRTEFKLDGGKQNRLLAQTTVVEILKTRPLEQVLQFLRVAVRIFTLGNWPSGAYGGAKWGVIALAPLEFLEGKTPHAVYVDHVFDLQHNGGRVFDKHTCFNPRDQHNLGYLLEWKKHDNGSLSQALQVFGQYHCRISPGVQELIQLGKKEGAW